MNHMAISISENLEFDMLGIKNELFNIHVVIPKASLGFCFGFGLSFRDYITQRKIEYAKELLLKGTSVADTSSAIGYSNVTYFIKRFKEKVGVTPGSYKSSLEGFRHVE